jgi:hypothetical protein
VDAYAEYEQLLAKRYLHTITPAIAARMLELEALLKIETLVPDEFTKRLED